MADKPRFEGGKTVITLKEACTLIMGQSPSSDSYNADSDGLPFYQGNADFGEDNPTPRIWCTDPKKIAEKGDILISVRAPIGAINIANEQCCIGRGVAAIRPNAELISKDFLRHQLCASRNKLEAMGTGSTFKAIGKKALNDLAIAIYPKREQEAIACQFNWVAEQTKVANSQLALLDTLVKSRFVEMFERGQRWELRALAECCTTPDDIKCGPFGSQLHKEDYISEGVPVWGIPEVNANFRCMPDKYVSLENGQRLQSYSLAPGDVAMNRKGNVGQAALFDGKKPSGIIHSDVLRVRVDQDVLSPAFLVEQFHSSHVVREQIVSASTGAIMAGTNVTKLKKIKVFVPPLALQQEFADFVVQVDKSRFVVQQQIDKLQILYDSLAQEYFA